MTTPVCRCCEALLSTTFVDLGASPLANSYLTQAQMNGMEPFFPLHAYVCERCWLVQLEAFHAPGQIFDEYAYFSSYSTSWLTHAQRFAEAATKRFNLNAKSLVVEAASNDGYLLQYFRRVGVPVLGIEPATNVAQVALDKGIPTTSAFMGVALAKQLLAEGQQADLLIGINVFAHVPDLHDFVGGMERLLKPRGVLALEFPHLLRLIEGCQFDTIYHEHFSYFSLMAAQAILERHGLTVFDVEEQPTHGGSIRIYAAHTNQAAARMTPAPKHMIDVERAYGLDKAATYAAFAEATHSVKRSLLRFLIDAREGGKQVVGYGAPAKGNTLLNYCGIRGDLLPYTVDISPHKQGLYLPGTHIPILAPEHIAQTRPDYVLILPWNLKEEITAKMAHIREWGGRFVVPLPSVEVLA